MQGRSATCGTWTKPIRSTERTRGLRQGLDKAFESVRGPSAERGLVGRLGARQP